MSAVSIIDGRLGFDTQSNQNQQFLKCIFTASLLTFSINREQCEVCSACGRQADRLASWFEDCKDHLVVPDQHLPVDRAVTRSSLEWKVKTSNLRSVKSDTVLPTARHRDATFLRKDLCFPQVRWRGDGSRKFVIRFEQKSREYNERFDLCPDQAN